MNGFLRVVKLPGKEDIEILWILDTQSDSGKEVGLERV